MAREVTEFPAGGANVKSGIVTGVNESSQKQVNFVTPFSSVPDVVPGIKAEGGNKSSSLCVENVTVNGFEISTKGDGVDAFWKATDAGNP